MSDEVRCARCGEVAAGYAKINGERYCHPDDPDAPDCYGKATFWAFVDRMSEYRPRHQ